MKCRLMREGFNISEAVDLVSSPKAGGIVIFLGKVRNESYGRKVLKLIYEAYEDMAVVEMERIREEGLRKFPIEDMLIWHRYGELEVEEETILVIASGKHRKEAFEACIWAVDEVKRRVPVWKREVTEEGTFWIEGSRQIRAD